MSSLHRDPPVRRRRFAPPMPPATPPSRPVRVAPPGTALAIRFSTALAVVNAIAGLVSVFVPDVFRDDPAYAGNARGTFAVILVVALPAMVVAMRAAARGWLRAGLVWLACVGYLLYNAVLAAFSLRFNALFPLYVASLSLGVASLVALLRCLDPCLLARRLSPRVPVHAVASYLIVIAVGFAALWLADIVPALVAGTVPASLRGTTLATNAVEVIDLAFTLPLTFAAGLWLWRGRAMGVLLAGTMLVFLTLEAISVATDQYFGHLADPSQPTGAITLFIVLTVVGALPAVAFLRGIIEPLQGPRTRNA